MLLGFKTQNSVELDAALRDFEDPPGSVARVVHLWLYTHKSIYRFSDGSVVIKVESFFENICKYAFLFFLGVLILGLLLNNNFMIYSQLPFIVIVGVIVSSTVHVRQLVREIKKYGHPHKIKVLNYVQCRVRLLQRLDNND